jgi:hypothetical protein
MDIDLSAARDFMAGHARALDRHRLARLTGEGEPGAVLGALEAYRNADGGYGWGLEPDLRTRTSQPGGALHALEAMAEAGPETTPRASALCDWLDAASLAGGGLPFALPIPDPAACAPFWVAADHGTPSLQITAVIAAEAHAVAAFDPAVAAHPWLERATRHCLDAILALDGAPHALVLAFSLRLVHAIHATHPDAAAALERLAAFVPADGIVHVEGGLEDEVVRPLDMAPRPGPVRELFGPGVVEAELDRLAAGQRDDGGWEVDFASFSPQGALEWRGHATVRAIGTLRAAGRV